MKDSIDKNLDFKLLIFITLLGAWIWLLKYYISLIPLNSKHDISFCVIVASYIIFYPLVRVGMMLIYSSLYQIEEREDKIKELENSYGKNAKAFFGWWPIVLTMAPIFLFIAILGDKFVITLIISILYIFLIKTCCFKKILTFKDIMNYYSIFSKSFFIHCFVFIIIVLTIYFSR
jgi:hypothetical protein